MVVPLAPWSTLKLAGDAESEKFGAGLIVRLSVVLRVRLLEVPVIVTVTVPTAALLLAAIVNELVALAGFGLNEAVTPAGKPAADKATFALKPFC